MDTGDLRFLDDNIRFGFWLEETTAKNALI